MSIFGLGQAVSSIGEIILVPARLLSNWAEEPLKRASFKREEESKDRDVNRDIERQIGADKGLSEQRIKEAEHSTEMAIARETEIVRVITEIELLKKDKEFERMKVVSDAMMDYQKELTKINVDAVDAIGVMRIDLQRKAYELIYEKTAEYSELQNKAIEQAQSQLVTIENLKVSEANKEMLSAAVGENLASIIKNATRFIEQLNTDMQLISKDINLITASGQEFIQRHLEQFQMVSFSEEMPRLIEEK